MSLTMACTQSSVVHKGVATVRYRNLWVVAQRRSGILPLVLLVSSFFALGGIPDPVCFEIEG